MTVRRTTPRLAQWLGLLLVVYLAYPFGAFFYRVVTGSNEGWNAPGLWSALWVSVEGSTVSLLIGVVTGVPLAYALARRRGWLSSVVGVIVQLPLALPPLIAGILLVYIVGPYSALGQFSGERLTQTIYGLVIAQSFVSAPFLVVVARSAFRAVDPSLDDVSATLGYGPVAQFFRVDVPAASDGLRTGMILMWLRAFGEYGTTVVLAYHPYSIPVYVDNIFSSSPLSQAEAPTVLAIAVAAVAAVIFTARRPGQLRRPARLPAPIAPTAASSRALSFDLDMRIGSFHLAIAQPRAAHRLAILGPSGSGKSQTLRAIAGLAGADVGTVTYGGVDASDSRPQQRHLGYVPQGYGLLPARTVWEQVTFGVGAVPARAAWWLSRLHLDDVVDRMPDQLSGGQRQRVSLARALAGDPGLLLLDEPFSALDAVVRDELRRELRRVQQDTNLTTVVVTHDPIEAAMLADDVVVISDGQVLQSGSCRHVYRHPDSVVVGRLLGIDNLFCGVATTTGVRLCTTSASGEAVPTASVVGPPPGYPSMTDVMWQVAASSLHVVADPPSIDLPGSGILVGPCRIIDVIDLGRSVEVTAQLTSGIELTSRQADEPGLATGAACWLQADATAFSVWSVGGDDAERGPGGRR